MRKFHNLLLGAVASLTLVSFANAQVPYPNKPIRLVVPQPPGGASDIYARQIAQKMSEVLGQRIIIDNRAGASGNIGADIVAKAAPDGYTLLLTPSATLTVNPSLYAKMPFNSAADFAPITELLDLPFLLVVNPALPFRSVKDVVDNARKEPGKLNYASAGSGQMIHLAMELVKDSTNVRIEHVPYKGGGQALPDVISGQVQMMFLSIPATIQNVKAGQLRAIGVTSAKRSTVLPDVPTIAESGLPGYEVGLWLGLLAPTGTPADVIQKLNAAAKLALQGPALRQRLDADGTVAVGSSPAEMTQKMNAETAKWSKLIHKIGIKPE